MLLRLQRGFLISAVVTVVLSIVFILSFSAFAATKLVHYGYSGHGVKWREYVESRAREFEKEHPDVEIEIVVSSAYIDNFLVMLSAGIAPDVAEFNSRDGGQLQALEAFLDVRPYLERFIGTSNIHPISLVDYTGASSEIWAFPAGSEPVVTFFNRDLLDRYAIESPDRNPNNWTWEQAKDVVAKLTLDGDGDGKPDQWGIASVPTMWNQSSSVHQAGGALFDRRFSPSQSYFDSPEVLRGLEYLVELDELSGGPLGGGRSSATFVGGHAGLFIATTPGVIPTWFMPGNKVAGEDTGTFNWGIASPLMGPAGNATLIGSTGFQISKNSKHPDLAVEWIHFLIGTTASSDDFVRRTGRVPSRVESLRAYISELDLDDQVLAVISQALMNPDSYTNYTGANMNDIRRLYTSEVANRVFSGAEPPANVLRDLQQRVSAILAQNVD